MIKVTNAVGTLREQFDLDETEIKSMKESKGFGHIDSRGNSTMSYTTTITMQDGRKHKVEGTKADIQKLIAEAQKKP